MHHTSKNIMPKETNMAIILHFNDVGNAEHQYSNDTTVCIKAMASRLG
jgi:hypothetical protein